jgi:hypothetical protein
LIDEKTEGRKSRGTVHLKTEELGKSVTLKCFKDFMCLGLEDKVNVSQRLNAANSGEKELEFWSRYWLMSIEYP